MKDRRTNDKYWLRVANSPEPYYEVNMQVNTIHLLSRYLLREAMVANDFRPILKEQIPYIQTWRDYLSHDEKVLTIPETIENIANGIVDYYEIYKNKPGRRMNKRGIKFIKYKIRKRLEDSYLQELKTNGEL